MAAEAELEAGVAAAAAEEEETRTQMLARDDVAVSALRVLNRRQSARHRFTLFGRSLVPPILSWARAYRPGNLRFDAVAGLTVAVMLVPQSMAYAFLAGLPPAYGLYASVVPLFCYSLLGSSMQVAVGPFAIVSLLTASAISAARSDERASAAAAAVSSAAADDAQIAETIRLALAASLITGVLMIAMALLNVAAFITGFLSGPVLVGFISASACVVLMSQIATLLGVTAASSSFPLVTLVNIAKAIPQTNWPTLLAGIVCVAALLALSFVKKLPRWFPTQLLLVGIGIICGAFIPGIETVAKIKLIGVIPSGMPTPAAPSFSGHEFVALVFPCLVIAIVSFVNEYALALKMASKHNYEAKSNAEMMALGFADLIGSFFGAHPIGGSLSRTAVNDSLGARSPIANAISGIVILLVVFTLAPIFRFLPKVILAAIVVTSVYKLVDIKDPRRLWKIDKTDFALEIFSFLSTIAAGVSYGIFIAIGASLLTVVYRSSSPSVVVLGRIPGKNVFRNMRIFKSAQAFPGVAVLRIDAELYFANINSLRSLLLEMAKEAKGGLRAFVIDGSNVSHIDSVALAGLSKLSKELRKEHCFIILAAFHSYTVRLLKSSGVAKVFAESLALCSAESPELAQSERASRCSVVLAEAPSSAASPEWQCFTDTNDEAVEFVARVCNLSTCGVSVEELTSRSDVDFS